jgi:hypothetical protein
MTNEEKILKKQKEKKSEAAKRGWEKRKLNKLEKNYDILFYTL